MNLQLASWILTVSLAASPVPAAPWRIHGTLHREPACTPAEKAPNGMITQKLILAKLEGWPDATAIADLKACAEDGIYFDVAVDPAKVSKLWDALRDGHRVEKVLDSVDCMKTVEQLCKKSGGVALARFGPDAGEGLSCSGTCRDGPAVGVFEWSVSF